MAKMTTTVVFELDLPNAPPVEMARHEAAMRDPKYQESVLACMNAVAKLHAAHSGTPLTGVITGAITNVMIT